MSIGNTIIAGYESTIEDEYQANLLHKSNTIAFHISFYGSIVLGAVLAWILPSGNAGLPLLVLLPMVAGSMVGLNWLKKRTPRPRPMLPSPVEWAVLIFTMSMWVTGLIYNSSMDSASEGLGTAIGGVVGGVIGGAIGFTVAMWALKRGRARDIKRLDAEFADD